MTDWAEARSRFLLTTWFPGGHAPNTRKELADALRQARIDALEEAARAAEGYVGCDNIAAAIRALKGKQP